MPYTQAQLRSLLISLGQKGVPELGVYPSTDDGATIDDTILTGCLRTAPDGSKRQELAVGVVLYDRVAVAFPLIDLVKFAMQQHPDIVERAQAELAAVTAT